MFSVRHQDEDGWNFGSLKTVAPGNLDVHKDERADASALLWTIRSPVGLPRLSLSSTWTRRSQMMHRGVIFSRENQFFHHAAVCFSKCPCSLGLGALINLMLWINNVFKPRSVLNRAGVYSIEEITRIMNRSKYRTGPFLQNCGECKHFNQRERQLQITLFTDKQNNWNWLPRSFNSKAHKV